MGHVVDGTRVYLQDIRQMAKDVAANGTIPKQIILHWSAGWNNQCWDSYHINVLTGGEVRVTCESLDEYKGDHTYHRNSGNMAIGIGCCVFATTEDLGEQPPEDIQIECVAQIMAILSQEWGKPITIQNFITHAEAANNLDIDGWGRENNPPVFVSDAAAEAAGYPHDYYGVGSDDPAMRWDLLMLSNDYEWWSGGRQLRAKANYYAQPGVLQV